MNAHQALAKLRKAIPSIAYRENKNALDKDERQKHLDLARELGIKESNLRTELEVLRNKLLDVPEYKALRDELNVTRNWRESNLIKAHTQKISVGSITKDLGLFHVKVEGDNWEDVIARAKEKGLLK